MELNELNEFVAHQSRFNPMSKHLGKSHTMQKVKLSIVYQLICQIMAGHNLKDYGKKIVVISLNPQDYG